MTKLWGRHRHARRAGVIRLIAGLVVLAALLVGSAGVSLATPDEVKEPTTGTVRPAAEPKDEGHAAKPYMGWSSYSMQVYDNGQWITADQLIAQSDAMHDQLQPYGYEYINVDAGWNGGIDDYGRPVPSTTLYPDGLQAVIDHVHGNGQKFGLYFIPGISPDLYENPRPVFGAPDCDTREIVLDPPQQADYWDIGYRLDFDNPCAQKYIDSIVDLIAGWGVDFVKFDSVTPGSGISDLSLDARDDVAAWSPPEAAWDLVRAVLGAGHQVRRLLEEVRRRLAGRLGRRVLLRGRGVDPVGQHRPAVPRARIGGGTRDRTLAGTISTRSTSATARWTA